MDARARPPAVAETGSGAREIPAHGVPAYEVWIASELGGQDELCRAVAVALKELPLEIHARVLGPTCDWTAGELGPLGARPAAVLILSSTGGTDGYGVEALYDELVERTAGRLVAILLTGAGEPEPAAPGAAAFRARLWDRHRTRALPAQAGGEALGPAVADAVGSLIVEELQLCHGAALDRAFASSEDASPARIDELLGPAGAQWLGASAASLAQLLFAAESSAESAALDPQREPARARALEQRQLGLRAFELGEYAVAARHLRAALEDLPLDLASGYWLARLRIAEGGRSACADASRMAQRVARVAEAAGRVEEAALARVAAARAESDLGHYGRAEQQALEAQAGAPWLAEPSIELACQRARRGAADGARSAMRDAFHRDPHALLRFNREPALVDAAPLLRTWKQRMRGELIEAVGVALAAEQQVVRLFSEEEDVSEEAAGALGCEPRSDELERAPLLDIVAVGRGSADRTLGRLVRFADRVRDLAVDLGIGPGPRASGEELALCLTPAPEDQEKGEATIQILNWLYSEGERVQCGRPLLRYELRWDAGRELRTLAAPRTGVVLRIDIANGVLGAPDERVGTLRPVGGLGVELSDRVENERSECAELQLLQRRGERRVRAETRQAAFWSLAALGVLAVAGATWDAAGSLWLALFGGLLGFPALYAFARVLAEGREQEGGQERAEALRGSIRECERELARRWDDFRLLADRLAQGVRVFEDAMPVDALFTPGPDWSRRVWQPGTLLRLRSRDVAGEEVFALDDRLFPPDLAAELPESPAVGCAGFYRVTRQGEACVAAARWAVYFAPPPGPALSGDSGHRAESPPAARAR